MEVAEKYADDSCTEDELRLVECEAKAAIPSLSGLVRPSEHAAAAAAVAVVKVTATEAARLACGWAGNVRLAREYEEMPSDFIETKKKVLADWDAEAVSLLRCVLGDPFRMASFRPAWLTPAVLGLARHIYDERAFDLMPVLGAALSDAGCTDPAVLGHCVAETPHVRGCHVVDLILGRE